MRLMVMVHLLIQLLLLLKKLHLLTSKWEVHLFLYQMEVVKRLILPIS